MFGDQPGRLGQGPEENQGLAGRVCGFTSWEGLEGGAEGAAWDVPPLRRAPER